MPGYCEKLLSSFNSHDKCEMCSVILFIQTKTYRFIKFYGTYPRLSVSKDQNQITNSEYFLVMMFEFLSTGVTKEGL